LVNVALLTLKVMAWSATSVTPALIVVAASVNVLLWVKVLTGPPTRFKVEAPPDVLKVSD
jgi:hypothetical protein